MSICILPRRYLRFIIQDKSTWTLKMDSQKMEFLDSLRKCVKCGRLFDNVVIVRQRARNRDRYATFDSGGDRTGECCLNCATYYDRLHSRTGL